MAISKVPSTGINGSAFTVSEAAAANTLNIDSTSSIGIGGAPSRGVLDVFGGRVNIRGNSSDTRAFVTLGDATYINATVAAAYGGDLTINAYPLILSQGQIKFPATQSASSDANTLDDYEEGTWSPTITQSISNPTSITYGRQHGTYIKIGTLIYITFNLYISSLTNGSGTCRISNLPFACQNVNESDRGCLAVGYCSGFTISLSPQSGIVQNGASYIDLTTQNDSSATQNRSSYTTNTGGSVNIYATVMYRAAS